MGDFDALDELERDPTAEEIRSDRAANVREYFRAKRDGEDFRPVAAERRRRIMESTFTVKVPTDELEIFKEFASTLEERSKIVEDAIESISSFDWISLA